MGEGRELRTEAGRVEVLLTPGVVLRLDQNSAIRMLSDKLSDTRVKLLSGSAILESGEAGHDTAAKLIYGNWQVRVPKQGVYRIDSEPARVRVYKGEAEVSADGQTETATVREGEVLPLAAVLVAEQPSATVGDAFKNWAMSRSDAIAADNAIAAEITDDPRQIDASGLGLGLGGLSYFPLTGVPSLGITNPYGLSFWSPYQSALSSIYSPAYRYGLGYPGWPGGVRFYATPVAPYRIGTGTGLHTGFTSPRVPFTPPVRPAPPVTGPRAPAPHAGFHGAGRR